MLYQLIGVILVFLFFKFAIAKAKDPLHPSRREHPCTSMLSDMKIV